VNRPRNLTIGLVLAGVLGALDVLSVLTLASNDGPPWFVGISGVIIGTTTLVGLRVAWKDPRTEAGMRTVVISRVVSALLGIPAFFADEAGATGKTFAAVGIVLTAVTLAFIVKGRQEAPARA
jgi:hypothetical protein